MCLEGCTPEAENRNSRPEAESEGGVLGEEAGSSLPTK